MPSRTASALLLACSLLVLVAGPEAASSARDTTASARPAPAPDTADARPVAVVELFTSESCSSCPPADRLLTELVDEARRDGRPLYALSFHVAYWNSLGWEDPFSKESFSQRQRTYAQQLGARMYTPQMIVNGRHAFVGSDERTARRRIREALATAAPTRIDLAVRRAGPQAVTVRLRGTALPQEAVACVAVVERGLSRRVTAGENAGRTLHHDNVVRVFRRTDLAGPAATDTLRLALPEALDAGAASVIAYVQDASMHVQGAVQAAVPPLSASAEGP
jgi:hypothetical protein